ncbi:MAG: hypothetical protein EP305_01270, partial [Bacteroidetes bacterium]
MKIFLAVFLISFVSLSQEEFKSIHQLDLERFNQSGNVDASYYESIPVEKKNFQTKGGCSLDKVVYGWHPYWVGNAYQNYQW